MTFVTLKEQLGYFTLVYCIAVKAVRLAASLIMANVCCVPLCCVIDDLIGTCCIINIL